MSGAKRSKVRQTRSEGAAGDLVWKLAELARDRLRPGAVFDVSPDDESTDHAVARAILEEWAAAGLHPVPASPSDGEDGDAYEARRIEEIASDVRRRGIQGRPAIIEEPFAPPDCDLCHLLHRDSPNPATWSLVLTTWVSFLGRSQTWNVCNGCRPAMRRILAEQGARS